MLRKIISRICFLCGIFIFVGGCLYARNFEPEDPNEGVLLIMLVVLLPLGLFFICALLQEEKVQAESAKRIASGEDPILVARCTFIVTGNDFEDPKGKISIYTDRIVLSPPNEHIAIPTANIKSVETRWFTKTEWGLRHGPVSRLLLAATLRELGMLLAVRDKNKTYQEKQLVITYESDELENVVVLKDVPFRQLERTIREQLPQNTKEV